MIEGAGEFGASIASAMLAFGLFAASTWIGWQASSRLAPNAGERKGCALMALFTAIALALLILFFAPSMRALDSVACRGSDDYRACIGE